MGVGQHYDAVVVGAGPNGLVAAIELAAAGRSVMVLEGADRPGGGLRTDTLTEPGARHDVCATILPLAVASPAMRDLPWESHGAEWIHPDAPLAHPLPGRAVLLERSVDATADGLGRDGQRWRRVLGTVTRPGFDLTDTLLDPWSWPRHPLSAARFARHGVPSAAHLARSFDGHDAGALVSGLAAHSMLPLTAPGTAAYGLLLGGLAHLVGWPLARGGAQSVADALVSILRSLGGEVHCGRWVTSVDELPPSRVVLADTSPAAALAMLGGRVSARARQRFGRFRYGPGVFKVDWLLDGPVPWADPAAARAATVHVGGSADEIVGAEAEVAAGRHPDRPFVLLAQTSLFDPTRAPAGRHTLWGYCHVPNGSTLDMTDRIERQIERFAPGFRDRIVARHTIDTVEMERRHPAARGGDINGGAADLRQFVFRPTTSWRPWALPADGWYLCSSSIPPGGGVHGMCGRRAARSALARELR